MQRLRLDALQRQHGRLCRDGSPFTGIAYEVKDARVAANSLVADGELDGVGEAWDPGRLRVLFSSLTLIDVDETDQQFPKEGTYWNGTLFDGVAYAFDRETGILLSENDLRDCGWSREWYRSGARKSETYRPCPDGTFESEFWFESGQTSSIGGVEMGVGYSVEQRLRTLRLETDYPRSFLERLTYRVDAILDLAGPGITDDVVKRLENLPAVEELEFSRASISPQGLEQFHACTKLKKLRMRGCPRVSDSDVQTLLAHTPDCEWDGRLA